MGKSKHDHSSLMREWIKFPTVDPDTTSWITKGSAANTPTAPRVCRLFEFIVDCSAHSVVFDFIVFLSSHVPSLQTTYFDPIVRVELRPHAAMVILRPVRDVSITLVVIWSNNHEQSAQETEQKIGSLCALRVEDREEESYL